MILQNDPLSSKDFSKGLVTRSDIINNDPNKSPNCMDIKWFFDGAIGKRLGASTTNTVLIGSTAAAGWTIDTNTSLSTSLQSFWKMDEVSGSRFDAFGTLTLADLNTTGSIVGIRGQAGLYLASASNMLLGANTQGIQTGNVNFSISSWVYLNSLNASKEQTIVGKRDPEIDAPTVLLLHCDGVNASTTFPDSSASAHVMTANGNVKVSTAQSQFGGASANFTGVNGDNITTPTSADFSFGLNDFTIDFWVRFATLGDAAFIDSNNALDYAFTYTNSTNLLAWYVGNVAIKAGSFVPTVNTWYHIALTRQGTNTDIWLNGSKLGITVTNGSNITSGSTIFIGSSTNGAQPLNGFIDEFRISKGIARWTSTFSVPQTQYAVQQYEYWLYINTNNNATFRVSSTNTNQTGTVQASSFGALNTGTWYNVIAWHSNNSHIGISVNAGGTNATTYTTGLKVGSASYAVGAISDGSAGAATTFIDGRIDEMGFWKKILTTQERSDLYGGGTGNTFQGAAAGFGWGMFDFGASSIRWLTVACGTGIVASSNLGTTFVTIFSQRTQTYQSFERSKNVLIATSDAYDVPLFWAGSAGTTATQLAANSAPSVKYSINYNGFLVLLNSSARKRGFFYADENLQLTDQWTSSFDFPSSADDEITAAFILYKFLYVSTRYKIFRVAFVGGNPDWSFLKIKDWGFVPRTAKLMTIKGSQVVVGMDWQRRIRVFDGFEDFFISDNIENDNNYCDFALKKISYAGSGLTVCHAEADQIEQEYRLNVAIGPQSTQTTHAIVLNGRSLAMYPYQNQLYQAMCVAESNNQQHLMAVDRSGFVHILNSGNLDVSKPINDNFDSPLIYKQSPTQVSQSQQLNVYFALDSCGTIYQRERTDFSNIFSSMKPLSDKDGNTEIKGNEPFLQILRTVDVPSTYNTYQFQITSSAGTADPWKLTRFEFIQETRGLGMGG